MDRLLLAYGNKSQSNSDFQTFFEEFRLLAAREATRREPLGCSEWGRSSTDANFADSALKLYAIKN